MTDEEFQLGCELSDDALECAESDRKYKQKEQSNQVIFNEGKYE